MTDHSSAAPPSDLADGLVRAREVFEGAGLAVPPVPTALRADFRELGQWLFGTRELDRLLMYFATAYAAEAVQHRVEDYVCVSHAGHGMNSFSINYHLVYGPVAILAQTGWGGVFMDAAEAAAGVQRMFGQCAELIASVEANQDRLPAPPARLVVVESLFRRIGFAAGLTGPWAASRPRPIGSLRLRRTRGRESGSRESPSPTRRSAREPRRSIWCRPRGNAGSAQLPAAGPTAEGTGATNSRAAWPSRCPRVQQFKPR